MSLRSEVIRIYNELIAGAKKISELPSAGALTGAELIETVQSGANVKTTTQAIANLSGGGGGGTWGSITGTLSNQTDLQAALDAKSAIVSPTFTGTPAAPTAADGTNTTQIATTAFVINHTVGSDLYLYSTQY